MPEVRFNTVLGDCRIGWEGSALTYFRLPRDVDDTLGPVAVAPDTPAWIAALIGRVQAHLSGRLQDFADVPIDWAQVSAFQQGVYRLTVGIKAGRTGTYGAIAESLGAGPAGSRAVGTALGANPWPLIVPCHRVIAVNGKMTGFSSPGGIRMKTRLLALEGAELAFG